MNSGDGMGLVASLQRLAGTTIEILGVRLELFGTELEQEKVRIGGALLLAALSVMLLGLALALAAAFVILLVADGYRLAATGVLALLFGAGAAALFLTARTRLRAPPGGAFALSRGELNRDRNSLTGPAE